MHKTILLAQLLVSGAVRAQQWVSISKGVDDSQEQFIDVSRIQIDGDLRGAWFRRVYAPAALKNTGRNEYIHELWAYMEFACTQKAFWNAALRNEEEYDYGESSDHMPWRPRARRTRHRSGPSARREAVIVAENGGWQVVVSLARRRSLHRVFRNGIAPENERRRSDEDKQHEDASIRKGRSAGEPGRTLEVRTQKRVPRRMAAIWDSEEERFAPIQTDMHTDAEPKIPGLAQGHAHHETT